MTVLKTETAALAGMSENLWLEKACAHLIPALPLWIIEYAWTKRMMEVLEALGPPLWLEGDWHHLTLEEPCRIRVVAAEVWRIVQARDIKHFERVTEFVDVTYTLVPRLVTPIKHMKIMFGLQTLVIMWMLWNDQSTAKISDKIENFFPKSLPEYHKCSRRNMDLMQKNQEDFKAFAHVLARDRDMRETYIRDLMEEQYGERYAQKLEERLVHYLGELDKVLPQPTCIEQVLKQSHSYGRGEKILKKLLSRDSASLATVLKRLLHCAVTTNQSLDESLSPSLSNTCEVQRDAEVVKPSNGTLRVFLRSSQNSTKENRLSQTSTKELFSSQGLWQNRNTETISPQEKICDDGVIVTSTQLSDSEIDQIDFSQSLLVEKDLVGRHRQKKTQSEPEQKESQTDFPEQICSRHGKKMRSILQECSEELDGGVVQAECTPTSTQSTPPLLPYTPQPQASPNQHSLSSNPDSSSTNISQSYIQQVSLSPVSSKNPVAPSPSVLQQSSSSSQSTASKQLAINAGQILATVVFTEPSRTDEHNLTLSLESQSFLMQSKWLQPQVCLNRLSKEECARAMDSYRAREILEGEQEPKDDQYMLFDVNALYSDSYSEDSDSTDSDDPDYKPD
ncbi:uncharacterized protein LOC107722485 [Sinocyclocheilus rhinocerous]|uniref:uncharacterized protein LOC107722485 n=1 Tax=Sinocyclocheilus rhinocerous TaxID=307959 RepID=UPI0007BA7943|nr:PREDICTED: uncharacterized protein LOC107722485 [Sinocyclocheilus rhinocerous]